MMGQRVPELPDLNARDAPDMAAVRVGIDAIDAALVSLLARRMRFIERAGVIKADRGAVRDEWRKADVLAKVETTALREGFPPVLARALWEQLVEASIAHEFDVFDAREVDANPSVVD